MSLLKVWQKHYEPFNFIERGSVNVEKIAEYLINKNQDVYFNEKIGATHHKHGKAFIIQEHPRHWFYGTSFLPNFVCEDNELWELTKPIVNKLEEELDGKAAQIFYLLLPPGDNIYIHVDLGQYFSAVHRHQIPIITNPQCDTWVNGETKNLKAGEIWEINNVKEHAVDNNGKTPRINLVIDIMPTWAIEAKEDKLEGVPQ